MQPDKTRARAGFLFSVADVPLVAAGLAFAIHHCAAQRRPNVTAAAHHFTARDLIGGVSRRLAPEDRQAFRLSAFGAYVV